MLAFPAWPAVVFLVIYAIGVLCVLLFTSATPGAQRRRFRR